MHAESIGAIPQGVSALFVRVEVDRIYAQLPSISIVGMADTAVREAREFATSDGNRNPRKLFSILRRPMNENRERAWISPWPWPFSRSSA